MAFFDTMRGIMGSLFKLGGPDGNQIKNETDGLSSRNSGDSAYQNIRAKKADGSLDEHVLNWRNARDNNVLIEFSFDGADVGVGISAGDNTGKYGFCHTTGGAHTAGVVYYDTGAEIAAIKVFKGLQIITGTAVSGGTINLNAHGLYVCTNDSPPHGWTVKGDGAAAEIGFRKAIRIPITITGTAVSTTEIPSGSKILECVVDVGTPYSEGATIEVVVDGAVADVTTMATTENDPQTANVYRSRPMSDIDADSEGPVTVTIGGTPAAGAGEVIVEYYKAFMS